MTPSGKTEAGSAGMQPCGGIAWVAPVGIPSILSLETENRSTKGSTTTANERHPSPTGRRQTRLQVLENE